MLTWQIRTSKFLCTAHCTLCSIYYHWHAEVSLHVSGIRAFSMKETNNDNFWFVTYCLKGHSQKGSHQWNWWEHLEWFATNAALWHVWWKRLWAYHELVGYCYHNITKYEGHQKKTNLYQWLLASGIPSILLNFILSLSEHFICMQLFVLAHRSNIAICPTY